MNQPAILKIGANNLSNSKAKHTSLISGDALLGAFLWQETNITAE